MDDCVRLALRETAEGRWFTNPARTTGDLAAIDLMLDTVWQHVGAATVPAGPFVVTGHETDGRAHRAIICDAHRLGDGRHVSWVGFFAMKRRDVDSAPLTARDDELVREFPDHPGILSYSSLEFGDGNWGNLILLDGDEAREHWRVSERHADAARELAPRHYTDVRLHQGILPGGLRAGRKPVLRRTKYYDYRDAVVWRAEREWLR